MNKRELRRIAREYSGNLQKQLYRAIDQFDSDYNGLHIRAMAQLIVEHDATAIKSAMDGVIENANITI